MGTPAPRCDTPAPPWTFPTRNSVDLARRVPNGELVLYPHAGHGCIFQFHGQFVETVLEFLERQKACGAVVVWAEGGASGPRRPLGEPLEAPVHWRDLAFRLTP